MSKPVLFGLILAVVPLEASVSPAQAAWALAVSQEGATHWGYGSSWNKEGLPEARRRALASCEPHGANCKIVLDGAGGCVALAVGTSDNSWNARQATTRLEAAHLALDQCVKSSLGDCEIKHSFCEAVPEE
jgi:hypothetical protein